MDERRKALLGRFRAGTLERLRRVERALVEIREGRGSDALANEVARDLHTIKGESRMLQLSSISERSHAVEEIFLAGRASGALPSSQVCLRAQEELAHVGVAIRDALGDVPAAGQSPDPATQGRPAPERWVQVSAARVDDLCERLFDFAAEFRALFAEARRRSHDPQLRALLEGFDRSRGRLDDVTGATWALRLTLVEPALEDLGRHARELAKNQGKDLDCVVEAGGCQVERSVLDALWEPLLHLVRNAVDHGFEAPGERNGKPARATLQLMAEPVGTKVVFSIVDDGRGIDPRRIQEAAIARGIVTREAAVSFSELETFDLLFMHGFSTRTEASDLSGRGVGLDVVRSVVDGLGGAVSVESEAGLGSRFSLTVPATVTSERVLVIDCGGALFGLPSRQVREVVHLERSGVEQVVGGTVLRLHDQGIPMRSLSAALGAEGASGESWALVVEHMNRTWAISIPPILGEYELLRRPLDPILGAIPYLAASTLLDDGRLVLVLALSGLLRRAEVAASRAPSAIKIQAAPTRRRVMVVDDSLIVRDLVGRALAQAGFEVQAASDGGAALGLLSVAPPDLILCDIDMPGMDGFEVLRRVRIERSTLPMVMLTTRGSAEDRRRAASLGADAYLVKSEFAEERLVTTVRQLIGGE